MDYYNEKIVAKMLAEVIEKLLSDRQVQHIQLTRIDPGITDRAGSTKLVVFRKISPGYEMERSEASDSFRCGSPSGERPEK